MANLSNINNILRISSSGVGLNKDNTGPSELDIESAGADMIDMTRTGQKTYRFAISGASAFSLFDVAANADRLIINSAGNATFAGNVLAPRYNIDTDSTSIIQETNRMKFTNAIANDAGGFDFYTRNSGSTYINALQILGTGNATFAGNVTTGASLISTNAIVDNVVAKTASGNITFKNNSGLTIAQFLDNKNATFAGEISASDDINTTGKLFVNKAGAELRLKSTSDTGESYINFADPSSNSVGQLYYGHTDNDMRFIVNTAERMRITSGGEVGIGTNFVSAKLQVHSTNAGQPTIPLFIVNESTTIGTEARLGFAANTNNNVGTNRYSYISTINTSGSNGQDMTFATNATGASAVEKMRIKSNGVVYIGYVDATAIGGHKLEVNGALYASGNIRTNGIFSNNSAPDDDVFEAIQSGRKCSLKTYFSSGSTESRWVLKTSTGATDGSTVDALTVKPNYAIFNGGITFNGDTAAANQLDDYEEGTWTPVASDFSGNPATVNTTNSTGVYTKIGDLVYWRFTIQMTSKASMISGETFKVSGFPFTSSSIPGNWYRPSSVIIKQVTFSGFVNFSLVASTTYGYFFDSQSAGAGGTIPVSDIADNCALSVTGVYKAN